METWVGKLVTIIQTGRGCCIVHTQLESRQVRRKELHLVAQKAKKTSLNAQKRQATADARVRSLFVTTMAAAPPAAGATPGTPHTTTTTTTTTMAAHSITTYAEYYAALPDDLQGRYDRLLAPYDPASGRSHQQLLHRLLSMSDASPKAFVGLVEHSGSYCTVLVHRITLFKSHPVDVSDWDGKALGFGGDIMPGNHIELMEVPEDAFAVAPEHVVPTRENVNHLLSGGRCWAHSQQGTPTLSPSSAARWYRSQQPTYICCLTVPSHPASCGNKWGGGGGG